MRRKARRGGGRQVELTIDAIGGRGDGVARLGGEAGGRLVYVPGTVPGDRLRARLTGERGGGYRGEIIELIEDGPGRHTPPCRHYGSCGGCTLQHLEPARYTAWTRDQVVQALARRGLSAVAVAPLVEVGAGTRRRATVTAACGPDGKVVVGYRERGSHAVVDVVACLLLTPALAELLPRLRAHLDDAVPEIRPLRITATETDDGLDLLFEAQVPPDLAAREGLARLAADADWARVTWQARDAPPEPVIVCRAPRVVFGGVPVALPPGGFLQPSREGEAALIDAVTGFLPDDAGTVADLYAGCGTFALSLAVRGHRVHAVEGDAAAHDALAQAVRAATMTDRVTSEQRDLERRPLQAAELAGYEAVVFDPPRAGARAQAADLAASSVPAVIAVSCNPHSFARDARILVDGGYRLDAVTPIDQFPWSAHVELVASFRR